MLKLILYLILLQTIMGDTPRFGDEQIVIMLKEYFKASKSAPALIGHHFYSSRDETVIQIEIEPGVNDVNDALVFSFKAMSQLANISKTQFTHSVLVMHFGHTTLPVIAKTDLECAKGYFIYISENESQWRKNCLTIREH